MVALSCILPDDVIHPLDAVGVVASTHYHFDKGMISYLQSCNNKDLFLN